MRTNVRKLMVYVMLVVLMAGIMSQSIFAATQFDSNTGINGLDAAGNSSVTTNDGWEAIGSEGFSQGAADYTSIALDTNNTPYVAYVDARNGGKVTVKKYTDNVWQTVGTEGFSEKKAIDTSIAIDKNNIPYVVYIEGPNGKIVVKKFVDNKWTTLAFCVGFGDDVSMAIDSKGTPYVAYTYSTKNSLLSCEYRNGVIVSKYVKDKWKIELNRGSSEKKDYFSCPALTFDTYNTPYVAYSNNGLNVMKVSTFGNGYNEGLKKGITKFITMATDNKRNLYVACQGVSGKAVVRKYTNGAGIELSDSWEISEGKAEYTSIAIDSNGIPYVAFTDKKDGCKGVVKKYEAGEWLALGNEGFSKGEAKFSSIALDGNGVPYVAYQDGSISKKATVSTFAKEFEVTFDSNEGTAVDAQYIVYNGKAQIPTPPQKEGYIFENWYSDEALTEVFDFNTPITTDITLYAKWTLITGLKVEVIAENGTIQGIQESYSYGETAELTAIPAENYKFDGWYDASGNKVSSDVVLSFTVTDNITYTAKFVALPTAELTISIEGNGSVEGWDSGSKKSFVLGRTIPLKAIANEGSSFLYWKDSSRVLSTASEFNYEIGCNETLTAVFFENEKIIVTFKNSNGEIIKTVYLTDGDDVIFPEAPAMLGYKFIGWDKTADEIKAATEDIEVTALFEKIEETVTVAVYGGTGSGEFNIKDYVTVVANDPEPGQKFSHWMDEQGNTLCYETEYSFYALRDVVLTAVFVPDTDAIEEKASIAITSVTKTDDKISFVAERIVPEGNTIISHGIIVTNNSSTGASEADFIIGGTDVLKATAKTKGLIGNFILNKIAALNETWYARGFVIYEDSEENVFTIYSSIVQETMN
ncbi:InlB B-repeat-containing protein [Acetivibrio cellulolyticus]|uniref:InlB B-repeat-containing protein n=1 Tax=Acetivibrio cellulolyticus TaxID=35830 RepID=UPI0001E2D4FC|nr:InlB B-repeat-containing protein [Acetivibrio cellulolyticus]